jgi:hypothetical protein
VESDRFDDVGVEFLESPEPPPRRPRRGLMAVTAVIVAAGLGLGASALANSDDPTPRAPAKTTFKSHDGSFRHHGHGCRKGDRHDGRHGDRDDSTLGLRY